MSLRAVSNLDFASATSPCTATSALRADAFELRRCEMSAGVGSLMFAGGVCPCQSEIFFNAAFNDASADVNVSCAELTFEPPASMSCCAAFAFVRCLSA